MAIDQRPLIWAPRPPGRTGNAASQDLDYGLGDLRVQDVVPRPPEHAVEAGREDTVVDDPVGVPGVRRVKGSKRW